MALHKYDTIAARIGKWKAEILTVSGYVKTLEVTGPEMKKLPANNSKTLVFRRFKNYGNLDYTFTTAATSDAATAFATQHLLAEGVSPSLDTITSADVTVVVKAYGMAYGFTDETFEFYEDDIPAEITKQLGERKGTLEEQIDFASLQAGTQVIYAGGGSSRASVNGPMKLEGLRYITEVLLGNSAPFMTMGSSASPAYGSAPVESGWCVITNTGCISMCRDLTGWVKKENYAGATRPVHPMEKGSVEDFRFIFSPHLQPILGAGYAVGATGLRSTSSAIDVYLSLVMAKEAWGKMNPASADSMKPSMLKPGQIDKSDFLGQRGVFGMKFWTASKVLKDGYMYRYEHGSTALSASY